MSLVLLNLKSNQQIRLDNESSVTIGRGNVTGCADKRVSRNHLKITCKGGKIHLVALHANPCFFTRNGVPPVHQLLKDEEETLNEGDCIGLLPDAFWFLVTSNEGVKIKLEKQDAETSKTDAAIKEEINSDVTECPASPKPGTSSCVPDSSSEGSGKNNAPNLYSPELQKTRRLPLWMYEIDDPKEVKKSPGKRSLESIDDQSTKKHKASKDTEKVENVTPEVCEVKIETDVDMPSTSIPDEAPTTTSTSDGSSSKSKEKFDKQASSNTNETKRPICQYEGNCYRQNPSHKQDFSHPGDPDFVPYEDRPLCQYGASCYRKNAKHRVEYRHPPDDESAPPSPSSQSGSIASSPLPAKRKRKPIKKRTSDQEDDYDLDDPFINDASSDEYIPSGQSSEEELDTSFQDDE